MYSTAWDCIYATYGLRKGPFGNKESPRLSALFRFLDRERKVVLDVGCGDGRNALALLRRGVTVFGVEISRIALRLLKAKADREGLASRLNLILHDVNEGLPFRGATFDGVIDSFTFTFIRRRRYYLLEVYRVLRDGGVFLLEFNMQPHILTHGGLFKLAWGLMKDIGFKLLSTYRFFHAWGRISDETLPQVPALALIVRKP